MSEPNKYSNAKSDGAISGSVPQGWSVGRAPQERLFAEPIFVPERGDHSFEWPSGKEALSPEQVSRLISKTAYSIAQRRNFHAGYEIEDWLGAEAEVVARIREIEQASRVGPPAG